MSMWKLSSGTAGVIGERKIKCDVLPTTAYIMLGDKCRNNCRFCTQSRNSEAKDTQLSRITWPAFDESVVSQSIKTACAAGDFKRVCLQVVHGEDSLAVTMSALTKLKDTQRIPLCVSSYLETVQQARELVAAGSERVCVALDAATPEIYSRTKEGDWEKKWQLLTACAAALPGRITTHFIVGLGETEEEMATAISQSLSRNITVGLFAFTPVRGTAWADHKPPDIGQYRRIQIAHWLLKNGYGMSVFRFAHGRIIGCNVPDLQAELAGGKAFETSGCDDCNRPYYNERPRSVLFNYPRPLTKGEFDQAIRDSGLAEGKIL